MVAVAGAVHCTAATALVINEFCVCAKGPLSSSRLMLLPSGGDLLFPKIARFMSIFLGDRTLTLGGGKTVELLGVNGLRFRAAARRRLCEAGDAIQYCSRAS
jgi:hypothetical protein